MLGWLLRSALLYALWLALVDNIHSAELIAGIPAAGLSAGLWTAATRLELERMRMRMAMLRRAPAVLAGLLTETAVVTAVLARAVVGRRPAGRFRAVRFRATAEGPENAARWALVEGLGSLAPNRYVVGIDLERDALLVHELAPSRKPLDPLELG
jgi:multisubunit Na+/H+ antiporter MnhE subunit